MCCQINLLLCLEKAEDDMKEVQDMLKQGRTNIICAQQKQKETYDRKHFVP